MGMKTEQHHIPIHVLREFQQLHAPLPLECECGKLARYVGFFIVGNATMDTYAREALFLCTFCAYQADEAMDLEELNEPHIQKQIDEYRKRHIEKCRQMNDEYQSSKKQNPGTCTHCGKETKHLVFHRICNKCRRFEMRHGRLP